MFTDIVGYSALAQQNEDLSLELLQEHRDLLRPIFPRFGGKEIETIGDAFFLEFDSVQEAVHCAIEIQKTLNNRNASEPAERKIFLRIGIHVGDVVHMGEKVHGDGVNIAARIQPLARPGGICISDQVYSQVCNKLDIKWISRGEQSLKNIETPVKVFDVVFPWEKAELTAAKDAKKTKMGKYLWPVLALTAVILVAAIMWRFPRAKDSQPLPPTPIPAAAPELPAYDSIAVLPFENMSDEKGNEYFTRGIHHDILINLSKVKTLKVISRTSVLQYEDNKNRNMREIGEALGVGTILEGSVRRWGTKVRLTAQLIDARTDEHLWAETYDRDLTDIFALQTTLAEEIVTALKATLTPEEKKSLERIYTENTKAYDHYLKARDYHFQGRKDSDEAAYRNAERYYERAIEEDPQFALAYAQLSDLHGDFYWFAVDRSKERLQKAKDAVDRALLLEPDLLEGKIALAEYYDQGFRNYEKAQEILQTVRKEAPNNAEVFAILGFTQRRQGLWGRAIVNLEKAVERDPRNAHFLNELAGTYDLMGDFSAALEYYDKTLEVAPESIFYSILNGLFHLNRKEDPTVLRDLLEDIPLSVDLDGIAGFARWWVEVWVRNFEEALFIVGLFPKEVIERPDFIRHKEYYRGVSYHFMGEKEKSWEALELAVAYLEPALDEHPDDPRYHTSLGLAYALLGRKEEAIREGSEAVKLLPISKDAFAGTLYAQNLALIYAWVGETEKAIDLLEELLSKPGTLSVAALRNLPHWDPLRDNPRFQALLEKDQH